MSRYAEARTDAVAVIAAGWSGGAMLTSASDGLGRACQNLHAADLATSKISIALSKFLSRISFEPGKPETFARRLEHAIMQKAAREVSYAEQFGFGRPPS